MSADPRRRLERAVHDAAGLLAALREHLGADCDDEALDLTIASECDLDEAIAAVYASARDDEALAAGCAERIAELSERRARLRRRARAECDAIASALLALPEAARRRHLDAGTFSPARVPRPVVIVDEGLIPSDCRRIIPERTEPDRAAIASRLNAGEAVPGAMLGNGGWRLNVRTK